jgi:CheY-like chemotaxis protein
MNAIIGMTELVLDTELNHSQRDYLTMVQASADSLLALLNQVLDFSKIGAGKLELHAATFDLEEELSKALKALSLKAHAKGLELACRIRPGTPPRLVGDATRLRQIVVNLLSNAIKFTERGEVVVEVERLPAAANLECDGSTSLSSAPDQPEEAQKKAAASRRTSEAEDEVTLHFTIADTGIGIPGDKLGKIFDAFEQVDTSTTRRFGGTGLGLAICSRLVELMEGRIWTESEVGRGSTFHFTVRLKLARNGAAAEPAGVSASVRDTRILVVDDNATNRRILEETLANWGMNAVSVADGCSAIRVLREAHRCGNSFQLVLTDANMPELDGFELTRQVKADAQLGSTVIMMLTSGDRPGDIARCEQLGVAAYLLKPIHQSELLESILMALGAASPQRQTQDAAADETPPLRPLRILLAEDSLVNQKLAVGLLTKHGHTVIVANDGREAIAVLAAQEVGLVLMDVQMPGMDGFEATAAIRAKEKHSGKHVPIIAMTAHAMKGDRERCLAAGMDDYIAKPISAKHLLARISDVLATSSGER